MNTRIKVLSIRFNVLNALATLSNALIISKNVCLSEKQKLNS